MAVWKQILLSLLVVAAAFAAWVRFVPGAPETLARWGVGGEVVAAIAPAQDASAAPGGAEGASGQRDGRIGRSGGAPQITVVTKPVGEAMINDRLSAIGTGRALASVTVKPYSSGRLTEILVSSGRKVAKGDVLAKLDSDAEEIALDRARIAVEDAQARLERVRTLRRTNTATSVQETDAQLALKNAQLAQRDAELALGRRAIVAPIGGVIGIIPVEVGNTVGADTTVATIDDRSEIVVDFWVPERFASLIEVGAELTAVPVARPGDTLPGTVRAVDNRIDEASRTLLVQARLPNPEDRLRAGQSFTVAMRFRGDTYPAVDPLAVQWGADGAFVWAVREGKAAHTPVRIIQRNAENVLVQAELTAGESVVTQGVYAMRDGGPVQVAGTAPVAATPASDAVQPSAKRAAPKANEL